VATGFLLEPLAEAGHEVTGIDLSAAERQRAGISGRGEIRAKT
jgi:2-polyprenyl-3-methyl-5-hydroxy-6-metoxy-1,4-benzoquinol methylase